MILTSRLRDYLRMESTIRGFQTCHAPSLAEKRNVARLLSHHMDKCRELLAAEADGVSDDHYGREAEALV